METLNGQILSLPRMEGLQLSFRLETEAGGFRVVRMDPFWQKRDILFLRVGQTVEIQGRETEEGFLACQIRITDCCRRS